MCSRALLALLTFSAANGLKFESRRVRQPSAAECPGDAAYRGNWLEKGIEHGGFFGAYDPCPCNFKNLTPQSEKGLPDECHPELSLQDDTETLAAASRAQAAGGAMAIRMYHYIAAVIKAKAPANLLVFSVGNESPLWTTANRGGNTTFKEHSEEWKEKVLKKEPTLNIDVVTYKDITDRSSLLKAVVADPSTASDQLAMKDMSDTDDWQTIIVDGPTKLVGRMQPIYMASRFACKTLRRSGAVPVDVFIHDVDREVEVTWSDSLLGNQSTSGFRTILWPEADGHFPEDGGVAPLRHYRYDAPDQVPFCASYN